MEKNKFAIVSEGQSSERPSTPYEGYQYWNDEIERLEVYKDGSWKSVFNTPTGEVIEGSSYNFAVENGAIVTMGGVDVSSMVEEGVLTIASVSGDICVSNNGEAVVPVPSTPEPPAEDDGGENTEGE